MQTLLKSLGRSFWLICAIVFLTASVVMFQGCTANSSSHKTTREKPWVLVRDSSGAFSVRLPESPKEAIKTNLSSSGLRIMRHEFIVDPDSSLEVGLVYNDYPQSSANLQVLGSRSFFNTVQDAGLATFGEGRLIYSRDGTFDSYPMRDICFEIPDKNWRYQTRIIVVGYRMYQLIVVSSIGTDASHTVDTLLGSFLLLRHE